MIARPAGTSVGLRVAPIVVRDPWIAASSLRHRRT